MNLIDNIVTAAKVLVSGVATVGSLIVHHDTDTGKDSLNLVPGLVWVYGLAAVGCSISHDEPFSQCVATILSRLWS